MNGKKYKIRVVLNDSNIAVQCGHGEYVSSPMSNGWLWVLGAIAFPEENEMQIVDARKHRLDHQRDMTTQRQEVEENPKAAVWQKYLNYLIGWAKDHMQPEFFGMTPAGFDEWLDLEYSEDAPAQPAKCAVCGCDMVWNHPLVPEMLVASSCYIGGDTCYDCMSEHCADTNCLGCRKGEWPKCSYLYLKAKDSADSLDY